MAQINFSAPEGTVREFLTNLGITDEEAVRAIRVDSLGVIEVDMALRGEDGIFVAYNEANTGLPFTVMYTLHFVEEQDDIMDEATDRIVSAGSIRSGIETHIIEAFNTQMAWDRLSKIVAKGSNFILRSDEGERGKLRTFTFERMD